MHEDPVFGHAFDIECEFVKDSIAHGKTLNKTIFIYLTHDGPHPVSAMHTACEETFNQLDVWLFGHVHSMGLSAPKGTTVQQDVNAPPVRFLLGNGGFDQGQFD